MNLVSSAIVRFEPLRSIDFGDISGTYALVGIPLTESARLIKFSNDTDANLLVSFNGIDDHDFVSANGFALYDLSTNKADQVGLLELPVRTRIYVKQQSGAPSSGTFYVTVLYASQV
jgi:hypothetical protein